MEKQYKPFIDKATALDFAIRDGQKKFGYGYEISGKYPYNNYLSNDDWKRFIDSMSPLHFAQYNDADGGELIEKKGRWGLNPPKMASFGSSSRLIYECSKSAHLQSSVFKLSKDLIDSIHEEGIVAYTS